MKTNNKKNNQVFHAVDFMRQVRSEMTELFLKDKQKYFAYLKQVMEDFKMQQKKTFQVTH